MLSPVLWFLAVLIGFAIAFGITGVFFFWLANWGLERREAWEREQANFFGASDEGEDERV